MSAVEGQEARIPQEGPQEGQEGGQERRKRAPRARKPQAAPEAVEGQEGGAPTSAPPLRPVVALLAQASARVGSVRKGDRNTQQGFAFRGIDAVMNAVGPVFRDLGIVVYPTVEQVDRTVVEVGQKRTPMGHVAVQVTYTFTEPGGDWLPVRVVAEAMDSGDKATAKAMSVAFRTCLLQVLCLPTHDRDPDHDVYERAAPQTVEDVTALIAAATTVEELRALWPTAHGLGLADQVVARREALAASDVPD